MKEYTTDVVLPDLRKIDKDTLCWDCKRFNGGCSWTRPGDNRPVKGWNASKTAMGYNVHQCPEFLRDTYCRGRYKDKDDYIAALEDGLISKCNSNDKLRMIAKEIQKELIRERWITEAHMNE